MSKQSGFTLLELMIGIAVAAILATMAVPSFNGLIQRTRLDSKTNELFSAAQYARSESLRRNINVTICRSPNPAAAPPACGVAGDNGTWANGWIVFVDGATPGFVDVNDTVLRVATPVNGVTSSNVQSYAERFGFQPSGRPQILPGNPNGNGTIHVCNGVFRREIVVSRTGRVSVRNLVDNSNCAAGI